MTILKNARFVDGHVSSLSFQDGVWTTKQCGDTIIELADDCFVSAGWIDVHTHCFKKYEKYSDDIDTVGYRCGVTCVVDAGTAGSDTIDEFYQQAQASKTNAFAFLNIAKQGIQAQNELADLANIEEASCIEALRKYPDFIVGLKARMSKSVLQGTGNAPLDLANQLREKVDIPMMVHVGNEPALLEDVLVRLKKDDIVTHIFNPKSNGILDAQGNIKGFVKDAHEQGILFDVGHGSESFSFTTCEKAYQEDLLCDTISTDIYAHNRVHGPVYSLAHTMSKMLSCGYSLEEVVNRVTIKAANCIKHPELVSLQVNDPANLTIFKVVQQPVSASDAINATRSLTTSIIPIAVVVNGEYISLQEAK